MKIVIVGAGAMGSIYAAMFCDAGHEVWISDPWLEHTTAIAQNGLRVEGASGDRCVAGINLVDASGDMNNADLIVVATKASQVANAAKAVQPFISAHTKVLTIQNGLGSADCLAKCISPDNIYIGVADGFGASIKGPGHVHHTAMNKIRIGAFKSANESNIDELARHWSDAGFKAQAYADIEQLIWEKFICNVAYSAPCTVFNKSVKALLEDEQARSVSQQCANEAWRVAKEKQINLTFDDAIEYVSAFGERVGDAKPSMLLDHIAKRHSEIGAINGMVPVVAKSVGLSAPVNQVLTAIVLSRENDWIGV